MRSSFPVAGVPFWGSPEFLTHTMADERPRFAQGAFVLLAELAETLGCAPSSFCFRWFLGGSWKMVPYGSVHVNASAHPLASLKRGVGTPPRPMCETHLCSAV